MRRDELFVAVVAGSSLRTDGDNVPGDAVLVHYVTDPAPRPSHVRLILAHVDATNYLIITPDFEIYAEQLDRGNAELDGVRVLQFPAQSAFGIPGNQIYIFRIWPTPAELATLIAEGAQLASAERVAQELPVVAAPVGSQLDHCAAASCRRCSTAARCSICRCGGGWRALGSRRACARTIHW